MTRRLLTLDVREFREGNEPARAAFAEAVGDALREIGFFALSGHGIDAKRVRRAYGAARRFFAQPEEVKRAYECSDVHRHRGYTPFGTEHARHETAPDLKEFWQTGRSGSPHLPANVWPSRECPDFEPEIASLFRELDSLAMTLLEAASLALGEEMDWLTDMARDGNSVLRILRYPPLGADIPSGAVRSAAHEDINLLTLLVGATAEGLQVRDHDGSWFDVNADEDQLIVDSGDMLQSLTNGWFRSTTHRVVNPPDRTSERLSMPLFVHPRNEVDISPRPQFVERTGGVPHYPSRTAGAYLHERMQEIGLVDDARGAAGGR